MRNSRSLSRVPYIVFAVLAIFFIFMMVSSSRHRALAASSHTQKFGDLQPLTEVPVDSITAYAPPESFTTDDVVKLTAAHESDEVIIAEIGTSPVGQITPNDLIDLKKADVSDPVLLALLKADGSSYLTTTNDLLALKKANVSDKVVLALLEKSAEPNQPVVPR